MRTIYEYLNKNISDNLLFEGGHVFDGGSDKIAKEDIQPTLDAYLKEIKRLFPKAYKWYEKPVTLGSVGKKDYSGENDYISEWDVSNVEDMRYMFYKSPFNGDISQWDVSNVQNMYMMFYGSSFNGDISSWNVSKIETKYHPTSKDELVDLIIKEIEANGPKCSLNHIDVSAITDMSDLFRGGETMQYWSGHPVLSDIDGDKERVALGNKARRANAYIYRLVNHD